MKTKILIIVIVLFSACNSGKSGIELNKEKVIDIINVDDISKHAFEIPKNGEVKIIGYSTSDKNNPWEYFLYIYKTGRDKNLNFSFKTNHPYQKAVYYWLNDSTLKFKIYNTTNSFYEKNTYTYGKKSATLSLDSI